MYLQIAVLDVMHQNNNPCTEAIKIRVFWVYTTLEFAYVNIEVTVRGSPKRKNIITPQATIFFNLNNNFRPM